MKKILHGGLSPYGQLKAGMVPRTNVAVLLSDRVCTIINLPGSPPLPYLPQIDRTQTTGTQAGKEEVMTEQIPYPEEVKEAAIERVRHAMEYNMEIDLLLEEIERRGLDTQ